MSNADLARKRLDTTTWPGGVPYAALPIVISPVGILDFELAEIQTLLWLIQSQDVQAEEFVYLALIFKLSGAPNMGATLVAEVFVDVLGAELVVFDVGSGRRADQGEILGLDAEACHSVLQAHGTVAATCDRLVG